jgi:protein-L-isoaspartate(D-aspartate) O-methyltransferase
MHGNVAMSAGLKLPRESLGLGMTSQRARDRMVERLREQGIRDPRVLEAMRTLPRHLFCEEALATRAYDDTALPIGRGQTLSQPYVVARMTEALIEFGLPESVLELGTGSGYQAAVLAMLVEQVSSVERIEELSRSARKRLRKLGFSNVRARFEDGRLGWAEHAPFDAIIVTAAADSVDPKLIAQLKPGGVFVAPVGGPDGQRLIRLRWVEDRWQQDDLGSVLFVPLLGGMA